MSLFKPKFNLFSRFYQRFSQQAGQFFRRSIKSVAQPQAISAPSKGGAHAPVFGNQANLPFLPNPQLNPQPNLTNARKRGEWRRDYQRQQLEAMTDWNDGSYGEALEKFENSRQTVSDKFKSREGPAIDYIKRGLEGNRFTSQELVTKLTGRAFYPPPPNLLPPEVDENAPTLPLTGKLWQRRAASDVAPNAIPNATPNLQWSAEPLFLSSANPDLSGDLEMAPRRVHFALPEKSLLAFPTKLSANLPINLPTQLLTKPLIKPPLKQPAKSQIPAPSLKEREAGWRPMGGWNAVFARGNTEAQKQLREHNKSAAQNYAERMAHYENNRKSWASRNLHNFRNLLPSHSLFRYKKMGLDRAL